MFYKGVDISSLLELEDRGVQLYNKDGRECEGLQLCKENGVNSIRLRIWNEPSNVEESGGYCDLEHTVVLGKRIKEQNLHFLLDFHYSDFWADPGKQYKPKAWETLFGKELELAVYDYTKMVLDRLREEGCLPDMVQVGNEIRSGMLFPDGEVPNYGQLARLINAGIRAVRTVSDNIKVMIHLDQGGRYEYLREWFDHVMEEGLEEFDVIGISYYAFWHGTFMDLKNSMENLTKRYHKPVIVAETAHPWRRCEDGFVTEEQEEIAGFKAGIEEQAQVMRLLMNIVASTPEHMGQGLYYWEPLVLPMEGQGTWGNNMGVIDLNGKVLPGLREFCFEREDFDQKEVDKIYQLKQKPSFMDSEREACIETGNMVFNPEFSMGTEGWTIEKDSFVEMEILKEENCLYLDARQNFRFTVSQQIEIHQEGKYAMGVSYRGTNTTDVDVRFFEMHNKETQQIREEKRIYPTDERWMTYELKDIMLKKGTVTIGIEIVSPPVTGKIKRFFLYKIQKQ